MIGSSNFSRNFSHNGSRGNGVSLLAPKRGGAQGDGFRRQAGGGAGKELLDFL